MLALLPSSSIDAARVTGGSLEFGTCQLSHDAFAKLGIKPADAALVLLPQSTDSAAATLNGYLCTAWAAPDSLQSCTASFDDSIRVTVAAAGAAAIAAGSVRVCRVRNKINDASRVSVAAVQTEHASDEALPDKAFVNRMLRRRYVMTGCRLRLNKSWDLIVLDTQPRGEVVRVARTTSVNVAPHSATAIVRNAIEQQLDTLPAADSAIVSPAVAALRDMVSLPLLHSRAFALLGVECPKGILLHGPPGVGKTWAVRTVAQQLGARLFVLEAQSVFASIAGESEARLRSVFADAAAAASNGPCLLMIDEIDVLCPHRQQGTGEAMSARIVAQLLTLMDGMDASARGRLIVVGATNHPNSVDSALRRPGRFDRELALSPPDAAQREAILRLYTRSLRLHSDVDLKQLAQQCIGYVGADLEAVCREAALAALQQHIRAHQELLPPWTLSGTANSAATVDVKQSAAAAETKADDLGVIRAEHFQIALTRVTASSRRGVGLKDAGTTWADIGGLESVKQKLKQCVEWPMQHPETFQRLGLKPPRGVLLYGPPGCAKTTLVRAMANSASAAFLHLDGAAVYSSYLGEAERDIRDLFSRARANLPCVIFFDELDSIVGKRSLGDTTGSSGMEARVLSTLLNEMDGVAQSKGLLIVAATNRPDVLDDALLRPGRFDHLVYVPPPDLQARLQILKVHTRAMPLHKDVDLPRLARALEWYTGAEIQNVCREAALLTLRLSLSGEDLKRDKLSEPSIVSPAVSAERAASAAASAAIAAFVLPALPFSVGVDTRDEPPVPDSEPAAAPDAALPAAAAASEPRVETKANDSAAVTASVAATAALVRADTAPVASTAATDDASAGVTPSDDSSLCVTMSHFLRVMSELRPSLNALSLREYELMDKRMG